MAVKKKVLKSENGGDTVDLARHLSRVREAIKTLPPDEQEHVMNETTGTSESSSTSAAKATPRKKPAKKAAAKKPAAKATNGASDQVTLAEIAKSLKMEPRRARRILRGTDLKAIEVEGQRWTWKKGSTAAAKVKEVLQAADAS